MIGWPAMAAGLIATAAGAFYDMRDMEVPLFIFPPSILAALVLARMGLSPVWWFESLVCGTGMFLLLGAWCLAVYLARRLSRRAGPDERAALGGADLMCSALCCFVFGARGVWVTFFAFILAMPLALKKHLENDPSPYPLIPFYLIPYIAVMLTT